MGYKKSYSRQAMQKFTQQDVTIVVAGGVSRILDFLIPEEIIIKRMVLQVLPDGLDPASSSGSGACILSLAQSDSHNPAATDPLDENRLIRSACGSVNAPINLDDTITMRKLAGSGVHVYIENTTSQDTAFVVKCTLHYLEV